MRRGANSLVALALAAGVLALKLPTLGVPYHWDEMTAYVAPAQALAGQGLWRVLPGLHPPEQFFGHPAGLYLLMAIVYRAFGHSIVISHVVVVAFAWLGVYFTYRLGSDLDGPATGLIAAVFLFFTPIYFAQSGMVLADLPVAALVAMALHFVVQDRPLPYLLAGFALVALKETGAAVPFAAALWFFWRERRIAKAALYGSPLLFTLAFLVAQIATSRRLVPSPYFADHPSVHVEPLAVVLALAKVVGWVLVAQQRWVLTLIIVAAVALRGWRSVWRSELALFALVAGCFTAAFSFLYVLPRYLLPTFPLMCVVAALALSSLVKTSGRRLLVCLVVVALFVSAFFGRDEGQDSFSEDMQYVDVVRTHEEAAHYLAERHPGARVFALWPLSQAFTDPSMGYVAEPLTLVSDRTTADVVVSTVQGKPGNRELASWAEQAGFELERQVVRRGKRVSIYVRGGP